MASTGTKLFPALRKARPTLDQVLNFFRGVGFVHLYRQWGPLDPRDRRTGGTGQEGLVGTHRVWQALGHQPNASDGPVDLSSSLGLHLTE